MFKQKLARFFYGRNGNDALCRFLNWFGVALLVLSLIFSYTGVAIPATVLWYAALVCIVVCWARMLSKNLYKRQAENRRYLVVENSVRSWFRTQKRRWQERKTFKYFKCPSCKATLRVPRGKGTIQITCRKCGTKFKGNS